MNDTSREVVERLTKLRNLWDAGGTYSEAIFAVYAQSNRLVTKWLIEDIDTAIATLSPSTSGLTREGVDFSDLAPEPTLNGRWAPDLQDLVYTAINHVRGDYEDADENCAEQIIERLLIALRLALQQGSASREGLGARKTCPACNGHSPRDGRQCDECGNRGFVGGDLVSSESPGGAGQDLRSGWRLVPTDDTRRSFSDSLLPGGMIEAGERILDRVEHDLANYVAGETADWDTGMIAVAVYRAMVNAAPEIQGSEPAAPPADSQAHPNHETPSAPFRPHAACEMYRTCADGGFCVGHCNAALPKPQDEGTLQPSPEGWRAVFKYIDDSDWAFLFDRLLIRRHKNDGRTGIWIEVLTDLRAMLSAAPESPSGVAGGEDE